MLTYAMHIAGIFNVGVRSITLSDKSAAPGGHSVCGAVSPRRMNPRALVVHAQCVTNRALVHAQCVALRGGCWHTPQCSATTAAAPRLSRPEQRTSRRTGRAPGAQPRSAAHPREARSGLDPPYSTTESPSQESTTESPSEPRVNHAPRRKIKAKTKRIAPVPSPHCA